MKLIKIRDAAKMLGVSNVTLVNWSKNGTLRLHKKENGSRTTYYLDADTLKAMGDTITDIENTKQKLSQEHENILRLFKEESEFRRNHENEMFSLNKYIRKRHFLMTFCLSIPEMLQSLDILSVRESDIMQRLIKADDLSQVCEDYSLTKERVRQIFIVGCRKACCLSGIKEQLDEFERLKSEMHMVKNAMKGMKAELDLWRSGKTLLALSELAETERIKSIKQSDEMLKIFSKSVFDFDLSIRARNGLLAADIETVGDLCRSKQADLLKFRCVGKKSIVELEDLLSGLGLSFGMDVDRICQYHIEVLMQNQENGATSERPKE